MVLENLIIKILLKRWKQFISIIVILSVLAFVAITVYTEETKSVGVLKFQLGHHPSGQPLIQAINQIATLEQKHPHISLIIESTDGIGGYINVLNLNISSDSSVKIDTELEEIENYLIASNASLAKAARIVYVNNVDYTLSKSLERLIEYCVSSNDYAGSNFKVFCEKGENIEFAFNHLNNVRGAQIEIMNNISDGYTMEKYVKKLKPNGLTASLVFFIILLNLLIASFSIIALESRSKAP